MKKSRKPSASTHAGAKRQKDKTNKILFTRLSKNATGTKLERGRTRYDAVGLNELAETTKRHE